MKVPTIGLAALFVLATNIKYAEGFECSEYGSPLTPENLKTLFPFFERRP